LAHFEHEADDQVHAVVKWTIHDSFCKIHTRLPNRV
jgi:hypothetical protein